MLTPRGTPYRILQGLALHGSCPTLWDCVETERQARQAHAHGARDYALQMLLIARALWSARRNLYR